MLNAPPEHRHTLWLLLALNGVSVISMQFPVPAMPDLVGIFDTTAAAVQLTLTLYMVAYAVFQVVFGPLSDRFGRKPVLLGATAVYVAGSFLATAAPTIEVLIAARVLQAIGAAAGFVLAPAIARDVYGQAGAPSAVGYVSMMSGFMAAVGPVLGGLVHEQMGWRWTFAVTAILGVLMIVAAMTLLTESLAPSLRRVAGAGLAAGYAVLARSRAFLGYVLVIAFVNGTFYAYFAGGAFVAIDVLGLSPSQFGLMFIPAVAFFTASAYFSVRLAARFGTTAVICFGASVTAAGSVGLTVAVLAGGQSVAALLIAGALLGLGNGHAIPSAIAEGVGVEPRFAGTAAACLGASQMGMGAVASLLFGLTHDGTALPMAALMAGMASIALLSCGLIVTAARRPAPVS